MNRGMLNSPLCIVYGIAAVIITIGFPELFDEIPILFLGCAGVSTLLEWFTAKILEKLDHKKWWDYSGYYLNLHGRICLEGLLVFGLAGMAFTYIFSPWLDDFYQHMKMKNRKIICTVLLIFFAGDAVWSLITPNTGEGITSKIQPANEVCRENGEQYKYIASEGRIKLEDSIKLKNSI